MTTCMLRLLRHHSQAFSSPTVAGCGMSSATSTASMTAAVSSSILIVMGGPSPALGPREPEMGANVLKLPQTHRDPFQGVLAGRGLPVRLPQTQIETLAFTRNEQVVGS